MAVLVAVSAGGTGCRPKKPSTAARSWVMDRARSAKTVVNWVATGPSGVEPAAKFARADSSAVCCTAVSSAACSCCRFSDDRSFTTLRTVTAVALD